MNWTVDVMALVLVAFIVWWFWLYRPQEKSSADATAAAEQSVEEKTP
jgi:cbb3-type cytochrome oxidase subunit 3